MDREFQAYVSSLQRERDALVKTLECSISESWRSMHEARNYARGYPPNTHSVAYYGQLPYAERQEHALRALLSIRRAWRKAQRGEG